MNLEEFKRQIEENLLKVVGNESAQRIMKIYENDFPRFLEENWTVEAITPALIGYYIQNQKKYKLDIYQNVNGNTFLDIFEITKIFIENGKLVD